MIHFELIFVCDVRYISKFIFSYCLFFKLSFGYFLYDYLIVTAPFFEKAVLSPLHTFATLSKISCSYICRSIFGSFYPVPLIYLSIIMSILHCFAYCSLIKILEIRSCSPTFFIFKFILATIDSLHFYDF